MSAVAGGADAHAMPLLHGGAATSLDALDDPLELARFTRGGESAVAESSLQLAGLRCAACAAGIEAALRAVEGVVSAEVNYAAARARVRWQPARTRAAALVAAVRAAGYEAAPDTLADARALRAAEGRALLWRWFVAAFCAMQVMMLATPVYLAEAGSLAPDLEALLHRSAWTLTLPVIFFSAAPFFRAALAGLRARRIGMDTPVALGIAVAFVASSGAAFDPGGAFGREVWFDSLTMFVALLLGARWLEWRARERAAQAIERGALALPRTAWRLDAQGRVEAVAAARLAVGDRVRVPLGEAFPADGVLEGDALTAADESLLSGEATPRVKRGGDAVVGGSTNLGAPVAMRVLRVGADMRCEQIAALMREALTRRPDALRLADRWAARFLGAVLVLAAASGLAWWAIDPTRALAVAVAVLIVTCPCALALAVPAAQLAATAQLARHGVLLRRIEALETLARLRRIVFDKTGTVTRAQAQWRDARALAAGVDIDRATQAAAALAAWSSHPLARALAAAHPRANADWRAVQEQRGMGLEARDSQDRVWRLGSAAWLGATATEPDDDIDGTVFFGPAGQPQLALRFDEALADDAAAALRELRALGLEVALLSGDRAARVDRLAARLGIADTRAAATPEAKLAALREAQSQGEAVAMVGDGINDAPVLAQADVSFALAHGAEVARAAADAVLVDGRLAAIPHAVALARRCVRTMRVNLAWAALYNAACVPLAVVGALPPWAAGIGMAASSALVVGNAMRLARE